MAKSQFVAYHRFGVDTQKSKRIKASVAIRWLGAYRHGGSSVYESIQFELARCDEAAAEPFFKIGTKYSDTLCKGRVGLLIKPDSIFRVFPKDCWSEYGQLAKGQNPDKLYYKGVRKNSDHSECWVRMNNAVKAIVVQGCITCLHGTTQKQIKAASRRFNLPIYNFNNGVFTLYTE